VENVTGVLLSENLDNIFNLTEAREQLIVYSLLVEDIWQHGYYIAIREKDSQNRIFNNEKLMFNTQGDFRGYNHVDLWEQCQREEVGADKESIKRFLRERRQSISLTKKT
jgi:hypothetical protein